ncbi:MAG TPA: hypothetical protein VH300_13100 [Thermoleophilaceae bacterium]|jgi:hypothetical protein|nr:hypothetical protein [Thermoleophilaceae bacterium]
MASSNKRKTTMAKLNRERGLAERRLEKQARKAARKQAATHDEQAPAPSPADESARPLADQSAVEAAAVAFGDMAKTDVKNQD